jgi:hypothetical protein
MANHTQALSLANISAQTRTAVLAYGYTQFRGRTYLQNMNVAKEAQVW